MELITIKEFIILLFQMIFLGSSIFMIYISIFNINIVAPNKNKFMLVKTKEYFKELRAIYFILGTLALIISILSLTFIIGLNLTAIAFSLLILIWTYLDYALSKKYLLTIKDKDEL